MASHEFRRDPETQRHRDPFGQLGLSLGSRLGKGDVISGPQATSTPNDDLLTYASQALNENQLTLADLLMILDPSLELVTQDFSGTNDGIHWTERTLSVRACYEILYGIVPEKIPYYFVSSLLEIICFFLEGTFKSATDSENHTKKVFRSFLPVLHVLLLEPSYGSWVARILSVFYTKEGVVSDPAVNDLIRSLEIASKTLLTKTLRDGILALLHTLEPLRPDLIPQSIFAEGSGSFPDYRAELRSRLPKSQVGEDFRFVEIEEPKTYTEWVRTPLTLAKKDKWFTVDALSDKRLFVEFWSRIRLPDHATSLLTDPKLLDAYWLAPKPSGASITLEKRIMNSVEDIFDRKAVLDPKAPTDERTRQENKEIDLLRMFQLSEHISNHLHEILPTVATVAAECIRSLTTPIEIFLKAVANLSIVYLSGNDLNYLDQALQRILIRFRVEGTATTQLRILEAIQAMLDSFFRDLPRLWFLEEETVNDDRVLRAKVQFVHDETAIQACFVDTKASLKVLLQFLDTIFWEPLLEKPCERRYSLFMWSKALDIWKLMADVSGRTKEFQNTNPILVPHPQLLQCGLLHYHDLIVDQTEALIRRFIELNKQWKQSNERIEILRNILKEHYERAVD